MTRRTRQCFFYSLLLVFLCLGTGVVLYAQGWRLDSKSFAVTKVGAIYLRSFPAEAAVRLDGKPIKSDAGIFQSGTLINHLFPKEHTLALSLPRYRPWQRRITVRSSLVSEVKYAVLVPEEPTVVKSAPANDFWIIGGEPLLRNGNGELVWRDHTLIGDGVIGWTVNAKNVLTQDGERKTYFWGNLENGSSTNLSVFLEKLGVKSPATSTELIIDPDQNTKLLVVKPLSLSLVDLQRNAAVVLSTSTQPIQNVSPSRSWLAWTTFRKKENLSTLALYDRAGGKLKNGGVSLPGRTVKLAWGGAENLGVLQDSGEFSIYNAAAGTLSGTASDVRNFVFTDDGSSVATLENKSIEIFSLRGDKKCWRFNLPDVKDIVSIAWYRDRQHLFVSYPDKVTFLDLDDLLQENVITVALTGKNYYDAKSNRFYFLKDGGLWRLDFPS